MKKKKLSGILSRLDIFNTVMHEAPDWHSFKAQKIEVGNLKYVGDILREDVHEVLPQTPLNEVIQFIDDNDIQRVMVVDENQKLLGLISDRDLLRYFKPEQEGIWHLLSRLSHPFTQAEDQKMDLVQSCAQTTAGEVMTTDLVVVRKEMLIEEAMALMIEKAFKRLPVVDNDGRFQGMISRDSLLRTGFA
jgi:CBS domain-containing protein